ncbi:MAG: sugar transferase, partial [Verrucomicrobiota bacterium]
MRTQIHQVMDAGIFSIGFWVAHWLRAHFSGMTIFGYNLLAENTTGLPPYDWMYLVIGFGAPLVLETQGFYKRSVLAPRHVTAWLLLKACVFLTIGMVLIFYMSRTVTPRGVILLFGPVSFLLIFLKEELVRRGYKSKFGQAQLKKRLILIGSREDTARLKNEIGEKAREEIQIVSEFDLNETSIEKLLHFIHEHSVNGVLINAKHTLFGQVEKAILACELEGVETWLVADFFKTQISRTSFDDFYGRPVLVFHSGPE